MILKVFEKKILVLWLLLLLSRSENPIEMYTRVSRRVRAVPPPVIHAIPEQEERN
jgi:hypothetical protein